MVSAAGALSEEEYLAREDASDVKHEYLAGEIRAMAGGSPKHGALAVRLGGLLDAALRGRCIVHSSDVRIHVPATRFFAYPDLSVVCGAPERSPLDRNGLVNPCALVEVLSPSTEAFDRGAKFAHYRRIASLREVLLVPQDARRLELFSLSEGGLWQLHEAASGDVLHLPHLDVSIDVDALHAGLDAYDDG